MISGIHCLDHVDRQGQEFNPGRDRAGMTFIPARPDRDKMQIPAGTRIRVIPAGTGTFHLFNHFFRLYAIRMKTYYYEYAMCVHCTYH